MQKPVHIVPMWDKNIKAMRDVIMPGVGLYRTNAARTGQYAGVTEPDFGPDITENIGGTQITFPAWCRVTVKRLLGNQVVEFAAKEFWKENYATACKDSAAPNAMWKKRPYGQIAKCAEAQALRKAFPELGSAPTADEMEGREFEQEAQAAPRQERVLEQDTYPQSSFDTNLPKWKKLIQDGSKTADQIIKTVQSKNVLTEEQIKAIRDIKPQVIEGEVMTEEEMAAIREREMYEGAEA
jgi:phage recombination protein Bet